SPEDFPPGALLSFTFQGSEEQRYSDFNAAVEPVSAPEELAPAEKGGSHDALLRRVVPHPSGLRPAFLPPTPERGKEKRRQTLSPLPSLWGKGAGGWGVYHIQIQHALRREDRRVSREDCRVADGLRLVFAQ